VALGCTYAAALYLACVVAIKGWARRSALVALWRTRAGEFRTAMGAPKRLDSCESRALCCDALNRPHELPQASESTLGRGHGGGAK
jgi:hypothetical protein